MSLSWLRAVALLVALVAPARAGREERGPMVYTFRATETLTPVELNRGDTARFILRNGRVRTLVVEETGAEILERPRGLPGIVYGFHCVLRVDGQPLRLQRYVCTQEAFYEPVVVNGLRIWFDAVLDTFRLIPMRYPHTGNRRWRPRKDARFALQDASVRVCPGKTHPWYPNDRGWIPIGACYNGEDCWLGPYLGRACHGGLDINHRRGEPLWAPIDFDDQWFFNSLAAGHDNNRWRGIRIWPDGSVWALQTHHVIRLLVPEHTPIKAGTHYAEAAGVAVGSHNHTHYEFKVAKQAGGRPPDFDLGRKLETRIYDEKPEPRPAQPEVFNLDPWILFWQIFEDWREKRGSIRARIAPLSPTHTGVPVRFSGEGSRPGPGRARPERRWAFGDGASGFGPHPVHVFARPGVFPVTVVVDDGANRASFTQHITVNGEPIREPVLALAAPDELSFRPRPRDAMDVYGRTPSFLPFTLDFVARPSRPVPEARVVEVVNLGGGTLAAPQCAVEGSEPSNWLTVRPRGQRLTVAVNAAGLGHGHYLARVAVRCPGALNSPQCFWVRLDVRGRPPKGDVVVDDDGEGFACTPHFWVGHRFAGRATDYRTNGSRPRKGEFARFQPDLVAGTYEVSFAADTPFPDDSNFKVRVRHRGGDTIVRVRPARSRAIGRFAFEEGSDGYVDILAEDPEGLVIVDKVRFQRVGD